MLGGVSNHSEKSSNGSSILQKAVRAKEKLKIGQSMPILGHFLDRGYSKPPSQNHSFGRNIEIPDFVFFSRNRVFLNECCGKMSKISVIWMKNGQIFGQILENHAITA